MSVYSKARASSFEGSHMSAIANVARRELGLEALLIHSDADLFRNKDAFIPPTLFKSLLEEYRGFIRHGVEAGVEATNGVPIDRQRLRELLKDDYLILLSGMCGEILHVILVEGYNKQGFIVIDPLRGREVWDAARVERFLDTPIGRWLLALRRDNSAVEKLKGEIQPFASEAKSFLTAAGAFSGEV